jgi:hypothetical protein
MKNNALLAGGTVRLGQVGKGSIDVGDDVHSLSQ